jgi:hypothetical protein
MHVSRLLQLRLEETLDCIWHSLHHTAETMQQQVSTPWVELFAPSADLCWLLRIHHLHQSASMNEGTVHHRVLCARALFLSAALQSCAEIMHKHNTPLCGSSLFLSPLAHLLPSLLTCRHSSHSPLTPFLTPLTLSSHLTRHPCRSLRRRSPWWSSLASTT